ncbi:MAG: GNAT family N-acetyltransferase [Bacillota bacterium]|nr:GNAT family N-acetyltransferase [Bacillota bacterium]
MIFETERLILRPWKESDASSLFEYAKDERVGPMAGWPPHMSVENSLEIIKYVLAVDETYAICLKEDDIAIGSICLKSPLQSHTKISDKELEIGYWIGVPFWGNGYVPEAVERLIHHAFEDLECPTIWCGYYEGNVKSKRVMEKCGFRYHHTEENKPCVLMNDIRTEHYTRLTKEEWKKTLV